MARRIDTILASLGVCAALVSTIFSIYYFFSDPQRSLSRSSLGQSTKISQDQINESISTVRKEVNIQLDEMKKLITTVAPLPNEDKLYIQVQQLNSTVNELKSREDKLEAVILSNPTKALEMPLFQRDLENLKISEQSNSSVLKDSVDRIYDLNKWLLGAISISLITLALANFIKPKEK